MNTTGRLLASALLAGTMLCAPSAARADKGGKPAAGARKAVVAPAAEGEARPDLADTLFAAGTFTTLTTALQAVGLVDLLKGPGPYTVFAPTDEAWNKLPPGTVEGLMGQRARLIELLKRHIVSGHLLAEQIGKQRALRAQAGGPLKVAVSAGGQSAAAAPGLSLGDAAVVRPDILAHNGVIHAIDAVLLPAEPARKAR